LAKIKSIHHSKEILDNFSPFNLSFVQLNRPLIERDRLRLSCPAPFPAGNKRDETIKPDFFNGPKGNTNGSDFLLFLASIQRESRRHPQRPEAY